jgi:hypothetical protein
LTAGGGSAPCYWSGFAGTDAAPDGATRCAVNSAAPEEPKMPLPPGRSPGLHRTGEGYLVAVDDTGERYGAMTVPLNFGFALLHVFWLIKKHFDAEEER